MIPPNYILFLMSLFLIVFGSSGFKLVSKALATLFPEPKDVIGKLNSLSNIGTVTAQLLAGGLYEVLKFLLPFVTPLPHHTGAIPNHHRNIRDRSNTA